MCTTRSIVAVSAILLGSTLVATVASAQPPGRRALASPRSGGFGHKLRAKSRAALKESVTSEGFRGERAVASQLPTGSLPGFGKGHRGRHGGPPACGAHCRHMGRDVYETCVADGGSEEECHETAKEAANLCRSENQCGPPPPPPPPSCLDLCRHVGRHGFRNCLAAGGDEEQCAEQTWQFVTDCVVTQCNAPPPPCGEFCHNAGRRVFRGCMEDSGAEEECRDVARAVVEQCLIGRCGESPDCEERCGNAADREFQRCLEEGGEEAVCTERSEGFLQMCLDRDCG